ncbi:DNA-binding SARP family transcriptional activator [Herbihabitans rhizosphaerae]|uniref:DNA-binding SARP family transcriptional activator n=1 Tax=Herbihabitans rhizosphaerae TaxID=1872711 RepID=A0A4Q7KCL6_9PSEU|nr:BTAD domain-containing putative transcriptional regulator [Herbihabitans rhizosphaerae]RZS30375.1 DNA-binding SARP family transcriptional activator [Herbihabitans rhizosphaerae]
MRQSGGTTFAVLGTVEMRDAGGEMISVGRPGRRALLALMLLRANRVVTVDDIVRQLWGDQPPATARAQVHALVSALRQAIPGGRDVLCTHDQGYVLRVEPDALDLLRFEHGLAHASVEQDKSVAAAAFRSALRLWRGTPFTGVDAAFVDRVRRRLDEQRLHALEQVIDIELGLGRHTEVIGELTELVAAHPRRERLHRRLMLALYRDGRAAEAMDAYRACQAALAEAGVSPSAKLDALAKRVLGSDRTLNLVSRKGNSRLPDAPANVPHDERLGELLSDVDGAPRITAITGPPAAGKSALAVAWAHQVAGRFADGVLYVDLAATPDPADALAELLDGLGVTEHPEDLAERAALFRSTVHGMRALLVLDNARDTAQVRNLLPGSDSCVVVVTSRDRLAGLAARFGARRLELS